MIVAHFEDVVSPKRRPKPSASVDGRATKVLRFLFDFKNVLFTFFMLDVLDELSTLSLMFQWDSLTILEAVDALCGCYLQLVYLDHGPGPLTAKVIAVCAQTDGKLHGHQLKAYSVTTPRDRRQSITGKYRFMNFEY